MHVKLLHVIGNASHVLLEYPWS